MVPNVVFTQSRWGCWEPSQMHRKRRAEGPQCHDRGLGGSQKTSYQIIAIIDNDFERWVVMPASNCDCFISLGALTYWEGDRGSGQCLKKDQYVTSSHTHTRTLTELLCRHLGRWGVVEYQVLHFWMSLWVDIMFSAPSNVHKQCRVFIFWTHICSQTKNRTLKIHISSLLKHHSWIWKALITPQRKNEIVGLIWELLYSDLWVWKIRVRNYSWFKNQWVILEDEGAQIHRFKNIPQEFHIGLERVILIWA